MKSTQNRTKKSKLLLLILLFTVHYSSAQNTSGSSFKNFAMGPNAKMSIWGNISIRDTIKIDSTASIVFYGETWSSEDSGAVTGGGKINFVSPSSQPGDIAKTQYIDGTVVPQLIINNSKNVILKNALTVLDTLTFTLGKIILDSNNLTIANEDVYAIQGYNEEKYIVTGNQASGGYLVRKGVTENVAFPVGISTTSYTPAEVKNNGTKDDIALRVFENAYENGLDGIIENNASVARSWDIKEAVAGGSNLDVRLQHESISEGQSFPSEHFITQFAEQAPNSLGDTLSNSKWDLLFYSKMSFGSSGDITTGQSITTSIVSERTGITSSAILSKSGYNNGRPLDNCATQFTLNSTNMNQDSLNTWSASWGDYDNDGYDDLFVPTNDINKPNILYHNNGDATFSKVTTGAIVTDLGSSIAGAWGDYDNDGYIDLFVANNINSSNKLYHNNGNGTFTSIENSPIVEKGIYSHAAAWADFNRDGNLDLVVSDYHPTNYNFIFLGDGNGGFTEDVTSEVALSATSAIGISWGDYDNDGDPDLFIANTNGENNQLFNNKAGVLTAVTTGAVVSDGGTSVGGTWGDYDNDGDLDLFVTNSRITEANFFYENNGDGTFTKITTGELVTNISASNGASWIDFDNDGYLDLMVANDQGQSNFLFRNNGNKTFAKLDNAITQVGSNSYGTAWSDFDNDGDYDLIVANRGDNANDFFINGKGSCTSHLPIKLVGCNSNKSAIGAMIKVKSTVNGVALWQTKDIATQNSAMGGQNSQKILFGLGDASTIDSVSVYWPSGIVTHLTNANVNTLLTITEQCGSQVCGVVYHDENGNGIQDSSELGIPNRSLTVTPGNFQVYTGANGEYAFFLTDGSYSLALNNNTAWNQTSPVGAVSLSINQATQSVYCGNDFGNSSNCTSPDFTITLGNTAMRRGLLNDLNVKITNQGAYSSTSNVSVEITMSKDIYLTDTNYTSISTSNNLRTYTFNLGTIPALSESILVLTDSVDVYATLEDTVSVFAKVIYSGSECDTLNNTASFSDIIVGSIDPNDKQVFVNDDNARYKMSESHHELLSYKIRFQNLGNYAARRVQIVDTLSTLLDWSTFQITGSSHDFKVSIANGVVTWVNERIELPSVEDNEEESNGYVTFNIAPKKGVAPYTIVHNVANIQFDRNEYIATNDASAVIGLGNLELNKTKLIVYPNPARESISLLLVDADQRPVEIHSIEVYSLAGNKETDLQPAGYKSQIDITQLSSGVYSLKVIATDGTVYHQKLIKI